MRRLSLLFFILLTIASPTWAQQGNTVIRFFAGVPSGTCAPVQVAVNTANGDFYDCLSGSWNIVSGGGGAPHAILSATHSDTLAASVVLGDLMAGNVTPIWQRVAGNITATKNFLAQTGTGAVSALPAWGTVAAGDIPNLESLNGTLDVPSGGTGAAPGADDQALISDSTSVATWRALTNCTGAGTAVTYATASNTFGCNTGFLTGNQTITLSGDATGSGATAITVTNVNLPDGVTQAGHLLVTNIAAPANPAAGKVKVYADSTDLRFHDKNASGVIGTTVVADTGAANNFLTAISAAGAISKAQPSFSNLSGTAGDTQIADGAVDGGTAGEIADASITSADLIAANKTFTKSFTIFDPTTSDTNDIQLYFAQAVTITRVVCSVAAATSVTIQLDERAEATPNTAGVDVQTSTLVCDVDSQATTSFTNATIAARVPLNLQITAVSGTPGAVRGHVEYTVD